MLRKQIVKCTKKTLDNSYLSKQNAKFQRKMNKAQHTNQKGSGYNVQDMSFLSENAEDGIIKEMETQIYPYDFNCDMQTDTKFLIRVEDCASWTLNTIVAHKGCQVAPAKFSA